MPLYYAFGLLVLFVILLVVEFMIPTAGLLGAAAVIVALAAIVIGFTHSMIAGGIVLLIILIITPIILATLIRVWPNTFIGKLILNRRPGQEHERTQRTTRSGRPLSELIGKHGVAKTDLLPAGLIEIEGHKSDAVSIGTPIDAGTHVVVVKVAAGRISVRAARAEEVAAKRDFDVGDDSLAESSLTEKSLQDTARPSEFDPNDEPAPKPAQQSAGDDIERRGSVLESLDLDSLDS